MLSASNSAIPESLQTNSTVIYVESHVFPSECKQQSSIYMVAVFRLSLDKLFFFSAIVLDCLLPLRSHTHICAPKPSFILSLIHPQTSLPVSLQKCLQPSSSKVGLDTVGLTPPIVYLSFQQGLLPIFAPPGRFPALLSRHLPLSLSCGSTVLCLHFPLSVMTFYMI